MERERFILHLNAADFAVAVERIADISLRSRPVIIAPLQTPRSVVYDMSQEAYDDGVRKGMALHRAMRACRSARLLPPRFDRYTRAMSAFADEARMFSPVVESGSGDGHLFVDISGTHRLIGPPPDIGWQLRKRIRTSIGIDPIWSLGSSRIVAKVASRLVKPVGEYIVAPGEEQEFLEPLPLSLLPELSVREMMHLGEFSIRKIGELAALDRRQLCSVFGRRGLVLHEVSRGNDPYVNDCRDHVPGFSREHVFAGDTADSKTLQGVVAALAVRIGVALREEGKSGKRMAVRLCYTDGIQVVRQAVAQQAISDDFSLKSLARTALDRAWFRRVRVRSLEVRCDRLQGASKQLSLFTDIRRQKQKQDRLLSAMDRIRERFGTDAVRLASQAVLA